VNAHEFVRRAGDFLTVAKEWAITAVAVVVLIATVSIALSQLLGA
jgi:hypothetical protein